MAQEQDKETDQPWTPPRGTLRLSATRSPQTSQQAAWQAPEDGDSPGGSPGGSPAAGFSPAADGADRGTPPLGRPSRFTWSVADEHEQLQRASFQRPTPRWRGRGGGDGKEANGLSAAGGAAGGEDAAAAAAAPCPGSDFEVETFSNSLQASMGIKQGFGNWSWFKRRS